MSDDKLSDARLREIENRKGRYPCLIQEDLAMASELLEARAALAASAASKNETAVSELQFIRGHAVGGPSFAPVVNREWITSVIDGRIAALSTPPPTPVESVKPDAEATKNLIRMAKHLEDHMEPNVSRDRALFKLVLALARREIARCEGK